MYIFHCLPDPIWSAEHQNTVHSLWKWCCRHIDRINGIHHHSQSIEVDNYCLIEFIDLLCYSFSSSCYETTHTWRQLTFPAYHTMHDFFTYGKQKTLLWYNYFKDPQFHVVVVLGLHTGEENNWSSGGRTCVVFLCGAKDLPVMDHNLSVNPSQRWKSWGRTGWTAAESEIHHQSP